MKTLNYKQLNQAQQQQVERLIADLEGNKTNSTPAVRFVARGVAEIPRGGEFALEN